MLLHEKENAENFKYNADVVSQYIQLFNSSYIIKPFISTFHHFSNYQMITRLLCFQFADYTLIMKTWKNGHKRKENVHYSQYIKAHHFPNSIIQLLYKQRNISLNLKQIHMNYSKKLTCVDGSLLLSADKIATAMKYSPHAK